MLAFFTVIQAAPESLKEAQADLDRAKKPQKDDETKEATPIIPKLFVFCFEDLNSAPILV